MEPGARATGSGDSTTTTGPGDTDERGGRLQRQREYQREYRRRRAATETAEERERRLERRRQRDRQRRTTHAQQGQPTAATLAQRRQTQALARRRQRAAQSGQVRQAVLEQRRQRRAAEEPEARESRLEQGRELMRTLREDIDQDSDAREARLEQGREYVRRFRANPDPEAREARLEQGREYVRRFRANPDPEAREARLEQGREYIRRFRANEDPVAREVRLEQAGECMRMLRENRQLMDSQLPLLDQQSVRKNVTAFHKKLGNCQFHSCTTCNESFPSLRVSESSRECTRCLSDKQRPKLYSAANGMDPGPVPLELQGLTQVEEMLISAIMPMMTMYRLPQGQYGYSGHIVNLPQRVSGFATSLPRVPSELDVVVVRKQGSNGSYKDFHVRRSKVLSALHWLQANNVYYRDITLNQVALSQLPVDGDLSDVSTVTVEGTETSDNVAETIDDPYNAFLPGTFVPVNPTKVTEQEIVRQAVGQAGYGGNRSGSGQPIPWPQVSDTPINEFKTEGYFARAFPTLFPTGAADFSAPRLRHVTIGYYFKHLMMYKDGRFARHPRFRYFALNTEMRWRALQTGRIYVRQHPQDARLTVDELRDMVGSEGAAFSSRVLHFATSLRGTGPYWYKQRSRLIAMINTLGLPTVFFTHSAADMQWPELAHLICPEDPDNRTSRNRSLNENPAVADWFFYHRIQLFIKHLYVDVLKVKDYWLRFEWQHRGSPHVHGLAWLSDAPDVQEAFSSTASEGTREAAIRYVDSIISTTNPAVLPDGSNLDDAPPPQVDPHVCNKPYFEVNNLHQDLIELVATCQRHTRCSPAYCLRKKQGKQQCRFGYPKPLEEKTTVEEQDGELQLSTARNDPLINSFNPVQLSAWRANVDMQYCLSRHRVIQYLSKYAAKGEVRSQSLKEIYSSIVRGLSTEDKSLKAVQKLLINTVGERDYSAQETCHLLLQLPLYMASRDFVILSLDGSRMVENNLEEGESATVLSTLDHYVARPSPSFDSMTLLHFTQHYRVPQSRPEPQKRAKEVVVIPRPYCPPDPDGPKYEQYCKQKMMLYRPFRCVQELLGRHDSYAAAYAEYLHSESIPTCLEDDLHRLQQQEGDRQYEEDTEQEQDSEQEENHRRPIDDWMLICQHQADLGTAQGDDDSVDWCAAARLYPNLEEAPAFIPRSRETFDVASVRVNSVDPRKLLGKQLEVFRLVEEHFQQVSADPLRMIISGTAGTGKSYLIHCLRKLLENRVKVVKVVAPTGVAACNVEGSTLHSLLDLPTRGELKPLEGNRLQQLQERFSKVRYLIIDEMSMVGRKMFGQVDSRLRQAFPHSPGEVLGGCSCFLFGDFGQLPPVMDLPLYSPVARSSISDLGRTAYQMFEKAVVLTQVVRQTGSDLEQVRFRELLLHLRDGQVTTSDWEYLMTRSATRVVDSSSFRDALHLHPTVEAVAEHNLMMLRTSGQPVAEIKAVHSGPGAQKASADEAGGLQPVVHLACGARVMLTSNLWVDVGLVNGALGTVQAICYKTGGPPDLPLAVMVKFDSYSGPTFAGGVVPIVPLRRNWREGGAACSRLQLPLKLAWAVTIHKAQGLTLDSVVIDVGKKEFCAGLTFVACSRVRRLTNLVFQPPFDFARVAGLGSSQRVQERRLEDVRLRLLEQSTIDTRLSDHIALETQPPPPLLHGQSNSSTLPRHQQEQPQRGSTHPDDKRFHTLSLPTTPSPMLSLTPSLPSSPHPMYSHTPSLPSSPHLIHSCTPSLPSSPFPMHSLSPSPHLMHSHTTSLPSSAQLTHSVTPSLPSSPQLMQSLTPSLPCTPPSMHS